MSIRVPGLEGLSKLKDIDVLGNVPSAGSGGDIGGTTGTEGPSGSSPSKGGGGPPVLPIETPVLPPDLFDPIIPDDAITDPLPPILKEPIDTPIGPTDPLDPRGLLDPILDPILEPIGVGEVEGPPGDSPFDEDDATVSTQASTGTSGRLSADSRRGKNRKIKDINKQSSKVKLRRPK